MSVTNFSFLALLFYVPYLFSGLGLSNAACGYDACQSQPTNFINVHLVPHSHEDAGWLKTFDQYYYGSHTMTQKAGVQYILDSVVEELLKDPSRRFIYVESSFFFKWWAQQSPRRQAEVKMLVNEGRLEFVGGGWTMNDEATPHYMGIIDQLTIGIKKLKETFGECGRPKVAWQIDAFGHTRAMAFILSQMGYDGLFFARLDWIEKNLRFSNQTAEMIWQTTDHLGNISDIFTGILYNHYSAPPGFCFDILCQDDPIIDGESPDNNVDEMVTDFIKYIENMRKLHRTNNLMVPMGDDFNYQSAGINFKNMDKLKRYVNARQSNGSIVNVFYSTPSCYLKSLYESQTTWPVKKIDFLPYSTDPHTYWTGFYTSRPSQKGFIRDGLAHLQVCEHLTVLGNLTDENYFNNINVLREALGILQHHDATTGTEKQNVSYDYNRLLYKSFLPCDTNIKESLRRLTNLTRGEFVVCSSLNISSCEFTENRGRMWITLYNPLAQLTKQVIRIPVQNGSYAIKDKHGGIVDSDLIALPDEVLVLPFRKSRATHELVFEATVELIESYLIRKIPTPRLARNNLGSKFSRGQKHPGNRVDQLTDRSSKLPKFDPVLVMETGKSHWSSYRFKRSLELVTRLKNRMTKSRRSSDRFVISAKPDARFLDTSAELNGSDDQPETSGDPITTLKSKNIALNFNTSGHLISIQMNQKTIDVRQEFLYYPAAAGNNAEFKNRSSGAYIFRPGGPPIPVGDDVKLKMFHGKHSHEVHQSFNDWVSQVVRIYDDQNTIEFNWQIGPIPIEDGIGKEVITRITSHIQSDGKFFVDSNGRELIERICNKRSDFTPNVTEKISSNYYPVVSEIAIEDNTTRMSLITDRTQGGTSVINGSIELMLHRRLLHDDAFGVGEALNETAYGRGLIVRGKYLLHISSPIEKSALVDRSSQMENVLPLKVFFSSPGTDSDDPVDPIPRINSLPNNIRILSMEPWSSDEILLRLESYQKVAKVIVNLWDIFESLGGESINETTLDGSMFLSDMKRFKFFEDGAIPKRDSYIEPRYKPLHVTKNSKRADFDVTFEPLLIRTFLIKKSTN